MKTKKFLSVVLALAMIFTMSVSVFADDNEFKADATVVIPAIDVEVPTTGDIFINPMGFTLNVSGDNKGKTATSEEVTEDPTGIATSNSQVASPMYYIENKSPMDLNVFVNPLATLDSGAKVLTVASSYDLTTSTKNEVFIYAMFKSEGNVEDITDDDFTPSLTQAAYTADGIANGVGSVAVPAKALKEPVGVGKVLKVDDDEHSGFMAMRFFGTCSGAPKVDWNNGEKVAVSLTFTFKPAPSASTGS